VSARLPFVDALKAVASQLIVLHHLAFYGPMSDAVMPWAGGLVSVLSEYGRLAVQVFLVVGGFLAARTMAPRGEPRMRAPLAAIARRWVRLAGPYAAAIALAVAAAAIARGGSDHPSIQAAPTVGQVLANLAMLQDVLGVGALSAGVWYVAIDLQLYACFAIAMALSARAAVPGIAQALVVALALASLLVFNRDPSWDAWAPYFMGSYALGALAAWAADARRPSLATLGVAVLGCVALWVEFRSRIAVATATAVLLAWAARTGVLERWPRSAALAWLGRISFSVFLVHYPVLMLFEAASARWSDGDPVANAIGLVAAFAASTLVGALFHRHVEAALAPRPRRAPAFPRTGTAADGAATEDEAAAAAPR
jgi:peptidoglycan/LPS O-acetylase OafA/YrhL